MLLAQKEISVRYDKNGTQRYEISTGLSLSYNKNISLNRWRYNKYLWDTKWRWLSVALLLNVSKFNDKREVNDMIK